MKKTLTYLTLFVFCIATTSSDLAAAEKKKKKKKADVTASEQPATTEDLVPPPKTPDTATDKIGYRLTEMFNVDQLPGSGKLTYKSGETTENIEFGQTSGKYALGMIFKGAGLPNEYGKDFKKNSILQVAMGTLREKSQGQIPQFAAVTLLLTSIPAAKKTFPLLMISQQKRNVDELGLFLFTAPSTPNDRSDEEKLRGTYFAEEGSLTAETVGKSKVLEIKGQGKKLNFELRMMKFTFDAKLVTPFNSTSSSLKGTIEFPVYSPYGKDAEALTQRIASESMESSTSLVGPPPSSKEGERKPSQE